MGVGREADGFSVKLGSALRPSDPFLECGAGPRAAGRPGCWRSLEAEVIPGQGLGLPEAPGAHGRPGL